MKNLTRRDFLETAAQAALAGTAIPFGARIIGAVEIYDALTTSRPYQEKMDSHFAVERLGDLIGTMIDPEVHRALAAVVNRHQVLTFVDEG
jgi:HD-GYP domain-containing protein (c-di-GMP phosphodiesterase class II)